MTLYDVFSSPVGDITVSTENGAITSVHIEGDRYFTAIPKDWERASAHPLLSRFEQELREYFTGERTYFNVPIAFAGTDFQQVVWKALQDIPSSKTMSYGALAAKIGRPKAVRAVGTAVGRNPLCIVVPCHRVLAGDGSLGGYVAGLDRKRQLLTLEGAIAA
jgi:methylated-DNA-[protein]-cysteine S-methyltransferase